MQQVTLTVQLPDGVWVADVSRSHPEVLFRVFAVSPGENKTGTAIVRISGPDLPDVLSEMEAHPVITDLSLVEVGEGEVTVQFSSRAPLLLLSATGSEMPHDITVEISDGEATVEVVGPSTSVSAFTDQLSNFGLEFEIEATQSLSDDTPFLSMRQHETITTAIEMGYYDTPRETTLTELATELDVAKSTCSETLHRAEERVIKRTLTETMNSSLDLFFE